MRRPGRAVGRGAGALRLPAGVPGSGCAARARPRAAARRSALRAPAGGPVPCQPLGHRRRRALPAAASGRRALSGAGEGVVRRCRHGRNRRLARPARRRILRHAGASVVDMLGCSLRDHSGAANNITAPPTKPNNSVRCDEPRQPQVARSASLVTTSRQPAGSPVQRSFVTGAPPHPPASPQVSRTHRSGPARWPSASLGLQRARMAASTTLRRTICRSATLRR